MDAELLNEAWHLIEAAFERCAEDVRKRHPSLLIHIGHWGNDVQPFWAWATFQPSNPEAEPLVLSVTLSVVGAQARLTADLMEEQGPILSEMPERRFASQASTDDVLRYIGDAVTFIRDQAEQITELL
jgi:hypothetical protein